MWEHVCRIKPELVGVRCEVRSLNFFPKGVTCGTAPGASRRKLKWAWKYVNRCRICFHCGELCLLSWGVTKDTFTRSCDMETSVIFQASACFVLKKKKSSLRMQFWIWYLRTIQHSESTLPEKNDVMIVWLSFCRFTVKKTSFVWRGMSEDWSWKLLSFTQTTAGRGPKEKGTVAYSLTNFNDYLLYHCYENSSAFVCSNSVQRRRRVETLL